MGTAQMTPERRLWAWTAGGAALVIVAGFAPTFYLQPVFSTPALSPLLVAHGVAMTLWLALLLTQLRLVAIGRTDWHRRLGTFGALLFGAILAIGVATAIGLGRRDFSPVPGVTPLQFMAVPFADLFVFGVLVGAALALRRRSTAAHKRLMLLATLSILAPAIARLPVLRNGGLPVIFGLMLLAVAVCIAVDTLRQRRLHPAFGWGGALVLLSVPGRIMVAGTEAWTRFAGWLIA